MLRRDRKQNASAGLFDKRKVFYFKAQNYRMLSTFLQNWSEKGPGPDLPVLKCEWDRGVGLRQAHSPQWLRNKVCVFFVFFFSFRCEAAWQECQSKLCSHVREDYKSVIFLCFVDKKLYTVLFNFEYLRLDNIWIRHTFEGVVRRLTLEGRHLRAASGTR